MKEPVTILGIESSCDDTAAAVVRDGMLLSHVVAGQDVHRKYGGVVPELASRAHQQHVVPTVNAALREAGADKNHLSAIAVTNGPGLLGSLLVGALFAKGFSLGLGIPMIAVHHLHAHIHSLFIQTPGQAVRHPPFPFLCLIVSGGHTQIVKVLGHHRMELLGQTRDDAAGEAFDKGARILGLTYPGGPLIDKYGSKGNPLAFSFPRPDMPDLDYSFSGLKTAFLYFVRDRMKEDPRFVDENLNDLCASLQNAIAGILLGKLQIASEKHGIKHIAIAGGVSANSALRRALETSAASRGWEVYCPQKTYCTDNAAMVATNAYFKYRIGAFASIGSAPKAALPF